MIMSKQLFITNRKESAWLLKLSAPLLFKSNFSRKKQLPPPVWGQKRERISPDTKRALPSLVDWLPENAENKEAKANVTDPDSRIMKTRKGYIQGLNAQAVVTEEQVIIAEDVTQRENDKQQLHPILEQIESSRQTLRHWPTPHRFFP